MRLRAYSVPVTPHPDNPAAAPRARPPIAAAALANLVLPGAGQWWLGRRIRGAVYGLSFLAASLTLLGRFVWDYMAYLIGVTSGSLFEDDAIGSLTDIFHIRALVTLFCIAIAIAIVSEADLLVTARRRPTMPRHSGDASTSNTTP